MGQSTKVAPQKMSVSNVVYNVTRQEVPLTPVKGKHSSLTTLVPPVPTKGKGLRITWREPLGDIRLTDIERKPQYVEFPRKCSDLRDELKADHQARVQAKREVAGRKLKKMSYAPNGKLTKHKVVGAKSSPNTTKMEIVTRQSVRSTRPPAQAHTQHAFTQAVAQPMTTIGPTVSSVVAEPENAANNNQFTQTARHPVKVQQSCAGQRKQARQSSDTSRMGQSPDHTLPTPPTRRTLHMVEVVADSRSDAGPTSKPQVSTLETDYDRINLLPWGWADVRKDIKDRSDNARPTPTGPSQLPCTSDPWRLVMVNAGDAEFNPRPSGAVMVEPDAAVKNNQFTQTSRHLDKVQHSCAGQFPDHVPPAQPTRRTLEMAEPAADL